jgi:2-desacetyl-2-hydroxyethyl bacteriochlorophyllide A dehydrogenase
MLTVVCETPGTLRAVDRATPTPGPAEVLVRVKRVGVCGTDLHIFTGDQPFLAYPRVMGHELSGIVEQAPDDGPLAAGDPVFVMPYLSCGRCIACARGKTNCCVNIQVLGVHRDGAFTEYLSVPRPFVHKAEGVTLDQAAMLEFLAIGAHAVRRGDVEPGQRVLVVGTGPIGMAVSIFAKLAGAQVTALDTRSERVEFCTSHLGAHAGVTIGPDDEAALSRLTGGDFFDVVFDATGNPRAMERGFKFIAHGGKYVLVSVVRDDIRFSDPEFHKREATLLGSRNATLQDFETVLEAMRAGRIPDQALNTHRLKLARVPEEFAALLDPAQRVVKAIIEC